MSKSITLSRLNDLSLGLFALVPPSETLDHLIRYLSTWSGSDKLFMVIQYAAKLLIPILHLRARLQHRAGFRKDPFSTAAPALNKLASTVSDARMLWRIWGLLPIFQWLISLERSPPPTRRLLTIERAQGWSMLAYYPMEHLYYLLSHEIIPSSISLPFSRSSSSPSSPLPSTTASLTPSSAAPSKGPPASPRTLSLDSTALSLWSTRFWALYVVLQFAHLREDRALLLRRERVLSKEKVKGQEHAELKRRWDAWWNELAVNVGYLPLTVHWSLEQGLFKNDIWVSIFGFAAAIASFRSGWKATAVLPLSPPPLTATEGTTPEDTNLTTLAGEGEKEVVTGYT